MQIPLIPNVVRFLTAAAPLVVTAGRLHAGILAADDFAYEDGNLVGKGATGGGWAAAWVNQFGNIASIRVADGAVVGAATAAASQRLHRELDASVATLTNGGPENNGTTIYVGIDYQFGARYGGLELVNSAFQVGTNPYFRLQLGSQSAGADLRTGGTTVLVPSASFNPLDGVNRYVMAITYDNTDGDMVELFKDGVSIGSSAPNAANDFSFNRVGFGVFVEPNGSIPYADNFVIATTFDEANKVGGEPPRITAFSYDPADGSAEATIQGGPGARFKLVATADLDFSTPDQDPVPLTGATVGTLLGGLNVLTDENGDATVQFNLGTGLAGFVRAEETGAVTLASYDFEAGGQGFTPTGDWAWGTPASDSGVPGGQVTTGNASSAKCWATVLGDGTPAPPINGGITRDANSILRSPNISLTGITGASLAFAAAVDAASGDTLEVLVRDAADNSLLGAPITPFPTNFPANAAWRDLGPFDLPAEAANKTIYLEFRFVGANAEYLGLYLDDVTISY